MPTLAAPRRAVKPSRFEFSLTLELNGSTYNVQPIAGIQDERILKGFRLEKRGDPDATYDVVRTSDGFVECSCPSYETTFRGNGYATCKHGRSLVGAGLLDAPMAEERGSGKASCEALPETTLLAPPSPTTSVMDVVAVEPAPVVTEEAGVTIMVTPDVEPAPCCDTTEEVPCVACSAAPAPDESFLAELDGDWSMLPSIDGTGLSPEEFAKVVHRGDVVRAAYRSSAPDAPAEDLARVERNGRLDALRAVLGKRPPAPCCDETETAPCLGCAEALGDNLPESQVIPVADPEPTFATSELHWADEPSEQLQPRLTLAQLIDAEVARMLRMGTEAGELMGGALAELARVVRVVSADRPDQVAERLGILEGYTEHALARDWDAPEPELTSAGRWA
jgi:hypothetical protein